MAEHMDEVQLVRVLLNIPLFEDLDYTQITSIIHAGKQRSVEPGEVLCESRTIDDRLVVLLHGTLRLESAEGGTVAELNPVRLIGEMGVFTGQTRSSRVVAEEAATILEIAAEDLEDVLEEDTQLGNHMMVSLIKLLYTRVHDVNVQIEVLQEQVDRLRGRLEEVSPGDPVLGELFPERPADPED